MAKDRSSETRAKGTILRTVPDRGFGFIRGSEPPYTRDFFFHHTSLENCTLFELAPGARVSFEPTDGPKGPRAEHVTWLKD